MKWKNQPKSWTINLVKIPWKMYSGPGIKLQVWDERHSNGIWHDRTLTRLIQSYDHRLNKHLSGYFPPSDSDSDVAAGSVVYRNISLIIQGHVLCHDSPYLWIHVSLHPKGPPPFQMKFNINTIQFKNKRSTQLNLYIYIYIYTYNKKELHNRYHSK